MYPTHRKIHVKSLPSCARRRLQTVWTQIRIDKTSGLIWIQTVLHSKTVHERIFFESNILIKVSRRPKNHEKNHSIQGINTNEL